MSSGRVRGYHYARRRDGTKYRVYDRAYSGVKKQRQMVRAKNVVRRSSKKLRTIPRDYAGDVIMGYGAYRQAAGSTIRTKSVPQVQNTGIGVIVRHREFIADVPSAINFASLTLPLNPGLQTTFPWLSKVAQCFEEWLPRGIVVQYQTTSSDTLIAANPALGSVVIATQYNSANPDFTNKSQMENYDKSVSCKPSRSMMHQVETARRQTVMDEMYIRTGPAPAGTDIRMYDLGKTQIASVGSQTDGSAIGEVWISYEIELRKPKIPTDPIVAAAHFILNPTVLTGETCAAPFGSTSVAPNITSPTSGSTMPNARLTGAAAFGTISFGVGASGLYLITTQIKGTGGTQGDWTFANFVNCSAVNAWSNNLVASNEETDAATVSATSDNFAIIINVTGPNASFSCTSTSTIAVNGTFNDVYIVELPDTMN